MVLSLKTDSQIMARHRDRRNIKNLVFKNVSKFVVVVWD